MCNKSKYMHLPIFFWKKRANFFFDEDLIDLGILSQNDITSEYHLTLQNSYHKPAVIQKISVEKNCPNFNIELGTFLRYKVPLPAGQKPFKALILIASVKENVQIAYCKGFIKFEIDVKGDIHMLNLPFRVGYLEDMVGPKRNFNFIVSKYKAGDTAVVNKFTARFKSSKAGNLIFNNVTLVDEIGSSYYLQFNDFLNMKSIRRDIVTPAFGLSLEYSEDFYDRNFTHGFELVTAQTMETNVCLVTRFYTMKLLCGTQDALGSQFHKCQKSEYLDFGNIAVGHTKIVAVDILNPTELPFKLIHFYTNVNSALFNLTIETPENKRNFDDPSTFLTLNKRQDTNITIPPGEVLTFRARIESDNTNSNEFLISFITNHNVRI